MDSNIIALLSTTLLGGFLAIAGGIIGSYITQRLSRKADKAKLIGEKLEALYQATEQVKLWLDTEINDFWYFFYGSVAEEMGYSKMPDVTECPDKRLLMLAGLYGHMEPKLKATATEFCNCVDSYKSLMIDAKGHVDYIEFMHEVMEDRIIEIDKKSKRTYEELKFLIETFINKL